MNKLQPPHPTKAEVAGVNIVAVIIKAHNKHVNGQQIWKVKSRIIRILGDHVPQVPIEKEHWLSVNKLTGSIVHIEYGGPLLKNLSMRTGILFRLTLPVSIVEESLLAISLGKDPEITVRPEVLRPMNEPCVRVPLSILHELRGQEAGIEYSRRSLVLTWSQDRRTGRTSTK